MQPNIYISEKCGDDNVKPMCDCDERIGLDINSLKTFDEMKSFFQSKLKAAFLKVLKLISLTM